VVFLKEQIKLWQSRKGKKANYSRYPKDGMLFRQRAAAAAAGRHSRCICRNKEGKSDKV